MKKLLAVLVMIALAIVTAQVADAAIANTKHNLRSSGTNSVKGDLDEICIYCHTPHGGTQAAGQPLWNRYAGSTTGFTAYSSGTLSSSPTTGGPGSQVCFSCHDGFTSINALRNSNGSPFNGTVTKITDTLYEIAGDAASLTNDHPIGMAIPTAKPDGTYKAPTQLAVPYAGNNNQVECSVCHAVHGTAAGIPNLLRISNAGSALCLDCHVK